MATMVTTTKGSCATIDPDRLCKGRSSLVSKRVKRLTIPNPLPEESEEGVLAAWDSPEQG